MMDSQAISDQMQSLLERIRRLEDADNGGWISAVEEPGDVVTVHADGRVVPGLH